MSAADPRRFAFEAVQDTLGKSSDVDSCVALTERIDILMSQALDFFQQEGIACRKGCSFCCHLRVVVYPHEAIALFRYLGSQIPKREVEGIRQRLTTNAKQIVEAERAGRSAPKMACALLVDGQCSAYPVRPGACSGYHSLSREHCEKASGTTPMLQGLHRVATALDEGTDEALATTGLSGARIELHTALAALIRNPSLIERWRSGRTLLKD